MPRDSDNPKIVRLVDLQRGLLLPLLVGGGSLGIYGGNVLGTRLDNEIEARKALAMDLREARAEIAVMHQDIVRLQEKVAVTERLVRKIRD